MHSRTVHALVRTSRGDRNRFCPAPEKRSIPVVVTGHAASTYDLRVSSAEADRSARVLLADQPVPRVTRPRVARVIGVEPNLPDALIRGVYDEISPRAEEWRAIGVFPVAVAVSDDAPLVDRLLGLTGRDPGGREPKAQDFLASARRTAGVPRTTRTSPATMSPSTSCQRCSL